jgi:hypothetical protein
MRTWTEEQSKEMMIIEKGYNKKGLENYNNKI